MKKAAGANPPETHEEIMSVLCADRLTTEEIAEKLGGRASGCPDEIARQLACLRRKGLINGEVSTKNGGWVWWIED